MIGTTAESAEIVEVSTISAGLGAREAQNENLAPICSSRIGDLVVVMRP
jgi:hypothetical protein